MSERTLIIALAALGLLAVLRRSRRRPTVRGMSSTCARRCGGCDGAYGSCGQPAAAKTVAGGDAG
jgi:hypothetical protein